VVSIEGPFKWHVYSEGTHRNGLAVVQVDPDVLKVKVQSSRYRD
jgi:hypothetical protein